MDLNNIRRATGAAPFRPFRMHLADGRDLYIPHPDFIALSTRMVIVVNHQEESVLWIEPLLIVSLDYPAGGAPSPVQAGGDTTNGPAGQGPGTPTS